MMLDRYSIVDPHPSVARPSGFVAAGRGGAGNYKRFTANDLTYGPIPAAPFSQLPPSRQCKRPVLEPPRSSSSSSSSTLSSSTSTPFHQMNSRLASTGIGGAGNMFARAEAEERVFMFDEELVKRRDRPCAPVYHIGRGGGGNWISDTDDEQQHHDCTAKPRTSRLNSNGSDTASDSSGGSVDNDANAQVRRTVGGALGRLRNRLAS